jgi:hypothetical protein
MTNDYRQYRMRRGSLRVILPDGIGVVEIDTESRREDGAPRVRVDVMSDITYQDPAADGYSYTVEDGQPHHPGVVFLTGTREES